MIKIRWQFGQRCVINLDLIIDPTDKVPPELFDVLRRSAEQAARGEFVPLEPVLDRIRASIARMEARRDGQLASAEV